MDLSIVISVATGLLVGAIAALKVFAHKTKTTVDDKVLERLEAVEKLLEGIKPSK